MNGDRTVHAAKGVVEIVRYDRGGRWYKEIPGLPRVRLTLADAVREASYCYELGGEVYLGRPGGSQFDSMFRSESAAVDPYALIRDALVRADDAFASIQHSPEPFDLAPFRQHIRDALAVLEELPSCSAQPSAPPQERA